MKAVILAAGFCSRIRSITNAVPKCLLRFGDRTILDFQIESLFDAGIETIAIVTGYGKEHITCLCRNAIFPPTLAHSPGAAKAGTETRERRDDENPGF